MSAVWFLCKHFYFQNDTNVSMLPLSCMQEIAQAMQGVDIMVTVASNSPWYHDFLARQFFHHLISDNLLTKCKAVIVRIVPWKNESRYARNTKPQTVDDVLKTCGLNASSLKDKLCKFVT